MTLEDLNKHIITRPDVWTSFGSAEDFDRLPLVHKDQIHFLDKEAVKFLDMYLEYSKIISEPHSNEIFNSWPFRLNYFRSVDKFEVTDNEDHLKKWIFNRGIPFSTEVYVIPDDGHSFITNWKIITKYAPDIFFRNDTIVFNRTLNWALFYFHHDVLYFGKENTNDPEIDYKKMEQINFLKRQFPKANFPY